MFFIKSLCVLFMSLLVGFCISTANKKTVYYYKNNGGQKTEITKTEYFDILNKKKLTEGKDAFNLSKENIYNNKNAIMDSIITFVTLLISISVFEFWKGKNKTN